MVQFNINNYWKSLLMVTGLVLTFYWFNCVLRKFNSGIGNGNGNGNGNRNGTMNGGNGGNPYYSKVKGDNGAEYLVLPRRLHNRSFEVV